MAKKNPDYWKGRMAALEDRQHQKGEAYYKDIQEQFRRASNSVQMDIERWYQRLADNNDISYAGAKHLLKKNELEEFKWTVEQYIKTGEQSNIDGSWIKELENASARHHISYLEALKIQMQQHAELLSTEFEGGMTDFLYKSYADSYYHTAYEMAKGTGIGTNLARLDDKRIDMVVKKPWAQDGANFSDRIWTNKQKLVNSLHTELTQNIIRGESPQKAIDSLARTMEVGRAQAGRLIMTESAAIASAAQKDSLKELGVGQYGILATLDGNTSEICRELDGKVFDMKDYEVGVTAPPFHPNCRSTTVPYFDDEFTDGEERAARDEETGETYYVPANMKYGEWEKKFVGIENSSDNDNIVIESPRAFSPISEDHYDELIDIHKQNITDGERGNIMGFDWDNFCPMNETYGYTNTKNSEAINRAMRENAVGSLPKQSQKTIEDLKKVISKNTIDEDVLVHRHVDEKWFADKFGKTDDMESAVKKAIAEGTSITDNQFVSGSLTEEDSYSNRAVKMIFQVPSGYHGYVTENRMESEVIFYRPSYRPTKVETVVTSQGEKQLVITCEMEAVNE